MTRSGQRHTQQHGTTLEGMMNGSGKGIKVLTVIGVLIAAGTGAAQEPGGAPGDNPAAIGPEHHDPAIRPRERTWPQWKRTTTIGEQLRRRYAEPLGRPVSERSRARSRYWNALATEHRLKLRARSQFQLVRRRFRSFRARSAGRWPQRRFRPHRPRDRRLSHRPNSPD
jgi:hypothetical protein